MPGFHRFTEIFDLFKSRAEAARLLGLKPVTLRAYALGERPFPLEKVDALVAAATARPGGEDVTHALVCRLASEALAARGKRAA